jgi:hypothetical protein
MNEDKLIAKANRDYEYRKHLYLIRHDEKCRKSQLKHDKGT